MIASILTSVKKVVGLDADQTEFDEDILTHINTVFSDLGDIGIGPTDGFIIEDDTTTWDAYLGTDKKLYRVKSYMWLRVKYLFDPPQTSFALEAMSKQIEELYVRISIQREGESWVDQTPRSPSTVVHSSRMC